MMPALYRKLMSADFSTLDNLATQWGEVHRKLEELPG